MQTVRELYDEWVGYMDVGGNIIDRVKAKGLTDIFQPLISLYQDDDYCFNKVFFYIILLYTKDSDAVIEGLNWDQMRSQVCRSLNFDMEDDTDNRLYCQLINFEQEAVTQTIQNWLDYQGNAIFTQLRVLKDAHSTFTSGILFASKDGKPDYEMRMKCIKFASETVQLMHEWEQRYKDENKALGEGLKELEKKAGLRKIADRKTLAYESNLWMHNEKLKQEAKKENAGKNNTVGDDETTEE